MRFARLKNFRGTEYAVNPHEVACVVLDDPHNEHRATVVLASGSAIRTADDMETVVRVLEDAMRNEPKP